MGTGGQLLLHAALGMNEFLSSRQSESSIVSPSEEADLASGN